MTKIQAKQLVLTTLKVSAAILLFTAKAFLYTCIALYAVGELLFSEYQAVAVINEEAKEAPVTGGEVYASMPWLEKEPVADVWEEVEPAAEPAAIVETAPVRSAAKGITPDPVLIVELPIATLIDEGPSDAEKEGIAIDVDRDRYQAMTAPQLRKECGMVGIKWRNAVSEGGTVRHLRKSEMLAALGA